MRRFQKLPVVLVTLALATAGTTVAAQEPGQRVQERIVIPPELVDQIQKIIQEAIGSDLARDLGRDLGRELGRVMRELPNLASTGLLDGLNAQNRDCTQKQSDRQTKTLSLGASGSLDLRNVVGDITVKAGGGRDATVEVLRVSCGRTDADAKLGLERVTVDVTSKAEHGMVITHYPEDRRPSYSVSTAFTVTVPAGTDITAHSIVGSVHVTGVKGDVSAESISGDVTITSAASIGKASTITGQLTITGVQSDGIIDASTVNGSVNLSNVKAKRLILGAVTGTVVARDVHAGSAEVNSMSGDIEYSGSVANTGRYEFQTHNGEIKLSLSGDFQFEGRSFSGNVVADQGISLTRSAGMRQVARATIGNGGAVVEATTFNGTVRIGRK